MLKQLRNHTIFNVRVPTVQLRLIVSTLGSPSDEDLSFVKSEKARAFMAKQVRWPRCHSKMESSQSFRVQAGKPKQPWKAIFKKANPLALDLLDRMLTFNPAKRITVEVRKILDRSCDLSSFFLCVSRKHSPTPTSPRCTARKTSHHTPTGSISRLSRALSSTSPAFRS